MYGNTFNYYYENGNHKHAVSRIAFNGQSYYYNYDLNGNMTYGPDFTYPGSIESRTIYYNADNMPTQINHSSGGITNYLYDGMGNRVRKSVGGTYTYYIGDHFEVRGGETIKYIFAGNLRVAQVKGGVRSFFHKDHLGSSTVMTTASGAWIESSEYLPFGRLRDHWGPFTSDYRFTDQELDAESGLYNYDARLYDPMIGRFISADTIVQAPYNPQSLNRYTYCLNNPLIYTDPSGLNWITEAFGQVLKWLGGQIFGEEEKKTGLDEFTCPELKVNGDGELTPPSGDIDKCSLNSNNQSNPGNTNGGSESMPQGGNLGVMSNPVGNSGKVGYSSGGLCAEPKSLAAYTAYGIGYLTGTLDSPITKGAVNFFNNLVGYADEFEILLAVRGVVRNPAQKSNYLKDLGQSGKTAKYMSQWLDKGKVPPGHQVDHIKPLSVGGKDDPSNMRLQGTDLHRTHHKYYHPWR